MDLAKSHFVNTDSFQMSAKVCSDVEVVQQNEENSFGSAGEKTQKDAQINTNSTVSSCGVVAASAAAALADECFCLASDVTSLRDRALLLLEDGTLIDRTHHRITNTPTSPLDKFPFTATSTLTTKPEARAVVKEEEEDVVFRSSAEGGCGSSEKDAGARRDSPEQQLLNTANESCGDDDGIPVVNYESDLSKCSNSNTNKDSHSRSNPFSFPPHAATQKTEADDLKDAPPPKEEKEARSKEEVLAAVAAAVAQWGGGDSKALGALILTPAEKRIVRNEDAYVSYIRTFRRQRTEEKNKRTSDNALLRRTTTTVVDLSSSSGMSLGIGIGSVGIGWSAGSTLPRPSAGYSVVYSRSAYSAFSGGGPQMQARAQPPRSPFAHSGGAHHSSFEYEKLKIIHLNIPHRQSQHQQEDGGGAASFSPHTNSSSAPPLLLTHKSQLTNTLATTNATTVYNALPPSNHHRHHHHYQSPDPMHVQQRPNEGWAQQTQMQGQQHHQQVRQSLHFQTAEHSHRYQYQKQQFLPASSGNVHSPVPLRAPSCPESNHIVQYKHNAVATPHDHGGNAQRFGNTLNPFRLTVPVGHQQPAPTTQALPLGPHAGNCGPQLHFDGCHSAHQFAATMGLPQQHQQQQQNNSTLLALAPHSPYRTGATVETSAAVTIPFSTNLPYSSFFHSSASALSSWAAVPHQSPHATSVPAFFFSSPSATASTTASPTLPPTHLPPQQTRVPSSATHCFPAPNHMYATSAPQNPSFWGQVDGSLFDYAKAAATCTPSPPLLQQLQEALRPPQLQQFEHSGAIEQQMESLSASLLARDKNDNSYHPSQQAFPSSLSSSDQNTHNNNKNHNNRSNANMFVNSNSYASVGGFELFLNTHNNTNNNTTNLISDPNASQNCPNQRVMTRRGTSAVDAAPIGRNSAEWHMLVAEERGRMERMVAMGLSSPALSYSSLSGCGVDLGGVLQRKLTVNSSGFHSCSVTAADFSDRPLPPAPVGEVFLMKPAV